MKPLHISYSSQPAPVWKRALQMYAPETAAICRSGRPLKHLDRFGDDAAWLPLHKGASGG